MVGAALIRFVLEDSLVSLGSRRAWALAEGEGIVSCETRATTLRPRRGPNGSPLRVNEPGSEPVGDLEARLVALVRGSPVLMRALRAARAVDPPDWLIGAGAIRDRVWDHLHGFTRATPVKDVDLAFFDPASLGGERERGVQRALTALAPDLAWDVTNQAEVHLWYPHVFGVAVKPLTCTSDAVATWPETATAIGVRLRADGTMRVVAPYGLDDLFALIWRRNPRCATRDQYRRRVENKQIAKRWPRVTILDAGSE